MPPASNVCVCVGGAYTHTFQRRVVLYKDNAQHSSSVIKSNFSKAIPRKKLFILAAPLTETLSDPFSGQA